MLHAVCIYKEIRSVMTLLTFSKLRERIDNYAHNTSLLFSLFLYSFLRFPLKLPLPPIPTLSFAPHCWPFATSPPLRTSPSSWSKKKCRFRPACCLSSACFSPDPASLLPGLAKSPSLAARRRWCPRPQWKRSLHTQRLPGSHLFGYPA